MKIRAGFKIAYDCPQQTPMILQVSVHPTRQPDLITWDGLQTDPQIPANTYHDAFGNFCHVITAPTGRLTLSTDFLVQDSGELDPVVLDAMAHPLQELPVEALVFVLGSRYCETDRLSDIAWHTFGHLPRGWPLVQAICDFTHDRIKFGYEHASPSKTAFDAYTEQRGVCRDFAHLAITLCRCMNIPARYCTGYLGDMGTEPPYGPGDFAAWFEAYLGGCWHIFDPRNNVPRLGRILMARGRDATDVAMVTSFGPCTLADFKVVTDEVAGMATPLRP
jgi:transglutaminase-like putative cysteine protease